MRALSTFLLILVFLPLSVLQAQVIDTSELNKLQQGDYSIAEGQLQVVFDDTTTRNFVFKEMSQLDITIKSYEFENIVIQIQNHPEKDHIRSLQNDEAVLMILNENSYLVSDESLAERDKQIMTGDIDPESVSDFKFKDEYLTVLIHLKETATLQDAKRIMDQYPELDFNVLIEPRRAAVVQTNPDEEENLIALLESKPYVKSVAYIGVLE